ncbi:MAG: flavin reductase family protein [Eubacteriales bacterium]
MKNIGAVIGMYPTPATIIGTEVDGKINWMMVAHVGIWDMDKILLSIGKIHYSNGGLMENKSVSINMINEEMLVSADYVGLASGKSADKSHVFEYFYGDLKGAPMIKEAPIAMECSIEQVYETQTHNNYIIKPINTYVREEFLSDNGKIDYEKVKPILFEMPNRQYFSIGKVVGKCWSIGKEYK